MDWGEPAGECAVLLKQSKNNNRAAPPSDSASCHLRPVLACPAQGAAGAVQAGEQPQHAGVGPSHLLTPVCHHAAQQRRGAGAVPEVHSGT